MGLFGRIEQRWGVFRYTLNLPTHVLLDQNPGLKVPSIVQLEQIFTIDKRRVQWFAGQTSEDEMKQIEMAIKISLGIN